MGHLVGIDLGTTNSAIAFTDLGKQRCHKVERNESTSGTMPSCVAKSRDGEILVGFKATRVRPDKISEFKRFIGEGTVPRSEEIFGKQLTAVDLSSLVLKKLKDGFEEQVGPIDGAIITVPAMFSELQRRETIEAGVRAGLNVIRVINEPSAAAIAYALADKPPGFDALVVDWGGGTLDVSLLDCDSDVLDNRLNGGDMKLGGKDVDNVVVDLITARARETGIEIENDPIAMADVSDAAEKVKIHLSDSDIWDEPISIRTRGKPQFIEFELDRKEFEAAISGVLDRAMETIEKTLAKDPSGSITPSEISEIIFVGGSCLIPAFRKRIETYFGRPGRCDIDPMEVVALGAAYQAASSSSSSSAELVVAHSLTKNLGVSCVGVDRTGVMRGDLFSCIIPAGTKVPAKATQTYSTIRDNQDEIDVRVYELDDLMSSVGDLQPWDQRTIKGLPAGPGGSFPINVTFDYRIDQTMEILIEVPGHDFRHVWTPQHQEKLEAGRAAGLEFVDEATGRRVAALGELASRVRKLLSKQAEQNRSWQILQSLERAIEAGDLDIALSLKKDLMASLFNEGLSLN